MPGKDGEAGPRRQEAVSWGLLALSVFVALGMAEWSKRTAAGETVIDPAVMEEAVKIAAAREGIRGLGVSHGGNGESEKRISDLSGGSRVAGGGLPATSNPKPATARSESVATMQTSAGANQ